MEWQSAGQAWGSRAVDWAYLFEPYSRPANMEVLDRCGVGADTTLLDIGCGSGFALQLAAERGATVAGLDASRALLDIAEVRSPAADLQLGDMDELPWPDARFDAVTSFNAIWAGCERAAAEAARVLKPGGRFGMTFWGAPKRLGLLPFFMTVGQNSPPSHLQATLGQGETGRPGVAEALLASAGMTVIARGAVNVTNEFPDLDLFIRAAVASGPAFPAVAEIGEERFREKLAAAYAGVATPGLGLRITSEFGWLTATK